MEQYRVEVTSENPFTDSVVASHAQALANELDHLANQGSVVVRNASGAEIAGWRFPADDPPEDSVEVGQYSQPNDRRHAHMAAFVIRPTEDEWAVLKSLLGRMGRGALVIAPEVAAGLDGTLPDGALVDYDFGGEADVLLELLGEPSNVDESPANSRLEVVVTSPDPGPTASLAGAGAVRDTAGRVRVWHPARDIYGWAGLGRVTWDGEG